MNEGTVVPQLEELNERLDSIQEALGETRDLINERDDEIARSIAELQAAVMAVLPPQATSAIRCPQLVRSVIPRGATVLVASKGDDALLRLGSRRAWHFPHGDDGLYAGYYPASAGAAIVHLEALRAKGAEYLVFPSPALWWLEHYADLRRHLERRYRLVARQEDAGAIYDLRPSSETTSFTPHAAIARVLAEFERRFDAAPAVLDWQSDLNLADTFPEYPIFGPPTADSTLPYLDHTIDIVVAPPDAAAEAHRVARAAVVTAARSSDGGPSPGLCTEWKMANKAAPLPSVDIIIPSFNSIGYTETCLAALRETLPGDFSGKVIVVDDASTDDTPKVLRRLARLNSWLEVVRNRENLGFIGTCNRGAGLASSEYIVFLNNDTVPLPGWLEALLRTFRDFPDAGAVGGRLVYPDGRLQEAGAVIFRDGSGANVGKWSDDPDAPVFTYVREVDYCSGALLAMKRGLFADLGGFDTRYRPAYYEDTDLCFSVRAAGYRVYFQPEAVICHFEGAVHGTDVSTGVKRYQGLNRAKFVEKWRDVLALRPLPPGSYDTSTWHSLMVRDYCEERRINAHTTSSALRPTHA
jgi:GT2 family glycosyltransferase